jgi:hypothetical protein
MLHTIWQSSVYLKVVHFSNILFTSDEYATLVLCVIDCNVLNKNNSKESKISLYFVKADSRRYVLVMKDDTRLLQQ